jgi:alpha-D-ribose 1-methylphosphonate 5-triphosphate diphosphatase
MSSSTDLAIRNVRAVLPDRVLDDATIVVVDGVIAAVESGVAPPPGALDGRGAFCLPGLVDTHSDGLEKELHPRPGVQLDDDFALRSFESRVRAAGVTTIFHGIGFEDDSRHQRSVALANRLCDAIEHRATSGHALADHRILYRLDARDPDGFDALVERLPQRRDDGALPLVSFEDHTPGQGQYTDRTAFERYIIGTQGLSEDAARARVDQLIAERDEAIVHRDRALPWLTHAASTGRIRLMAHDPTTFEDVEEALRWSAAIAEFPTTMEAARMAHENGLRTVCGAPNVLRGRSHSGNVSARELIAAGLCDGLASDYLPTTLLGAVASLVADGACSLPAAVRLVTSGPADTVGLRDRGRLVVGSRADLVLVRFDGRLATVRAVHAADDHRGDPLGIEPDRALTA